VTRNASIAERKRADHAAERDRHDEPDAELATAARGFARPVIEQVAMSGGGTQAPVDRRHAYALRPRADILESARKARWPSVTGKTLSPMGHRRSAIRSWARAPPCKCAFS